jgi:hypothetical protein
MDSRDRLTDQPEQQAPAAYEPPRIDDLGSLSELTLGPVRGAGGDGVSRNGPRVGSR